MLGQPAAWQTVCRPSRCTSPASWVNSGPMVAFTLIHGGLRSMGVSALRASMRSNRRPSGATMVTLRSLTPHAGDGTLRRPGGDEAHVPMGRNVRTGRAVGIPTRGGSPVGPAGTVRPPGSGEGDDD